MTEAVLAFLGILAGSVLTFFGVRFTARQSAKAAETAAQVNSRQVDVEEWKAIVSALREEVARVSRRLEDVETRSEEDREKIRGLEEALRLKERRHRTLVRYVLALLSWAERFAPEHSPPPIPPSIAADLQSHPYP